MEKLLHYAWKWRILPLKELRTTRGQVVEVIDPGLWNQDAGPDFFNAKVRIDGTLWVGNVELHLRSSDWFRHGHEADPAYDNVVLHVATDTDVEVLCHDGHCPPQVCVPIPNSLQQDYAELLATMDYPRCYRLVPTFPRLTVHAWMDALLVERLMERSDLVLKRLTDAGGDWERAYLVTLARNFGFSLNGEAFERWARVLPLHAAGKHRDNILQVEALFLGTAGLIERAGGGNTLASEFRYLAHKFSLEIPEEGASATSDDGTALNGKSAAASKKEGCGAFNWRYMRTRPQNFPHTRIRQLAQLFHEGRIGLSRMLEAKTVAEAKACYAMPGLSASTLDLLIINTVVPVLYAYGKHHADERYCERTLDFLSQIKAERNFILRQWQQCGITVETAADSQALIQLKRKYCDTNDCLRCRFGFEFLRGRRKP